MNQQQDFRSLGVSEETLGALRDMGYERPTDVQKETIPLSREGHDLVVQSRTGTGKTSAFGIPLVESIDPERGEVQAVVLTPTRELALQVRDETAKLGAGRGLKVQAIYGGDSIDAQVKGIEDGAHMIVGTPGRVLDLLRRGSLVLKSVKYFVLDEADRMLDMGFAVEMGQIMAFVPEERQTFLFSATIPLGIRGLIYHYLKEPKWVLLSEDFTYVKDVQHCYIITPKMQKEAVLEKLIEYDQPTSSMIFCNTRDEVRSVANFLARRGLPVAMISSDLTQKKREQVMAQFRKGEIRHLVATDVAARGIDIEELSHVFIYSTPDSPEAYIHRAGRTGRIGRGGIVVSLVSATDLVSFNRLANRYHLDLTERSVPTEAEAEKKKSDRILAVVVNEAKSVPEDDVEDLRQAAETICEHPDRDRILAYLLQRDFKAPVAIEEQEEIAPRPERRRDSEGERDGGRDGDGDGDGDGGKRRRRRRPRRRKPSSE